MFLNSKFDQNNEVQSAVAGCWTCGGCAGCEGCAGCSGTSSISYEELPTEP